MVIKYFIGGYVINTILQDRLDIVFSFRVEKYFTIERNTWREISYFRLAIYVMFSARCMNASTSPRFCYVYFSCILLWLLTYSTVKKYKRVFVYKAWSLSYCLVWTTYSLCSKFWPMNALRLHTPDYWL